MNILEMIKAENKILFEMINTLEFEKDALISDNIESLEQATNNKQELKRRIEEIEKNRIEIYGLKSLKEILPNLSEEDRIIVQRLGIDMERLVAAVQEMNNINENLIKQSLNYVRFVLNVMSPHKVSVYGSSGKALNHDGEVSMVINKSI